VETRITPTTTRILKSPIRAELPAQYIQQLPSIENLLLHLEGKGRSENTRTAYEKNLKALAIRADLKDTKAVELVIARYKKKNGRPITNNYKSKLCDHYATYCKFYKIEWEKPIYTPEPTTIQPPTQEKISMLISSARLELSIKLDISAQTGLRPVEIQGDKGLQANNIHPDQNTITARITKGCNPRPPLPITKELTARLLDYITKHNIKPDEILFKGKAKNYGQDYRVFRNRLTKKLQDPTLRTIRLYDLRHAYATKQLRRTQNAEIVRQLMGHKKLDTTQKYLHLLAGNSGEWIVEGTDDKERAKQLLKEDFQYQLTTPDGTMLFKKPK
jgi:integrase